MIYIKSFLIFYLLFLINFGVGAQPTISSVTPSYGQIGSTIVITGTNFSATPSNNTVFFGAIKAIVSSASSNSLSVTVPNGVTYSPISVTVNNLSAFSQIPFNVTYSEIRNITSNSFGSQSTIISGNNCRDVIAVDIDGDGLVDILNVNQDDNTFTAFRNISSIGSISFNSGLVTSTGGQPIRLICQDLDGDSKQDIIVLNSSSGLNGKSISVFRNTSTTNSISFAAEQVFACPTTSGPEGIFSSDFDLDGKPDICVTSKGAAPNNYFSIFRNTSSVGNVSFATRVDNAAGVGVLGVTGTDLDGDGKVDLAMVEKGVNQIRIARNTSTTGNISFSTTTISSLLQPYDISYADMDQDGKQDLVIGNYGADYISILKNTSIAGTISFATRIDTISNFAPWNISPFDFNGDQKIDILVNHAGIAATKIFENYGNGITIANHAVLITGPFHRSAISDLDSDGYPEIILGGGGSFLKVYRNMLFETTWTGSSSTNWDDSLNWTNDIPGSNTLATMPNTSNSPSISGTKTIKSISNSSNSFLTLSTGSNLNVLSSLVNNGTISGNGQLILSGSSLQNISGSGTIHNLNLNNSSGAIISPTSTNLNITGTYSKSNGVLTTNGNLILKSSASGTARVDQLTIGSISGNVTAERYIPSGTRRFRFLSSPVQSATLNGLLDDIFITGNSGNNGFDVTS
jgi:hypothetical protein